MDAANVISCPTCGQLLPADALVCPNCHGFVHRHRLEQLSAEAQRVEQIYPDQASHYWRQALDLLPPDSAQYQSIVKRLQVLNQLASQNTVPYAGPTAQTTDYYAPEPPGEQALYPQAPPARDPLGVALLKTLGSMAISIVVYAVLFRSRFNTFHDALVMAFWFAVLMLIHELGHVAALKYYGMSASPPIFIPFLGAVINLRQQPRNAWVEAVVGIGGPLFGTIAGIVLFFVALSMKSPPTLFAAMIGGIWLNLFNLLPVPPLDGGRITAAVSPRIWMVGLALLVGLFLVQLFKTHSVNWILLLVLFFAWPRIAHTLRRRNLDDPYYRIPAYATFTMAALYLGLAFTLVAFAMASGIQIF